MPVPRQDRQRPLRLRADREASSARAAALGCGRRAWARHRCRPRPSLSWLVSYRTLAQFFARSLVGAWQFKPSVDVTLVINRINSSDLTIFFRARRRGREGKQVSAAENCCQTTQTTPNTWSQTSQTSQNNAHATKNKHHRLHCCIHGTRRAPPHPTAHTTKRHAYPTTTGGRDTGGRDTGGR